MVKAGIDALFKDEKLLKRLESRKIGLVINVSSVNSALERTLDVFLEWGKARVEAIFALEHGINGVVPYMEEIKDETDPKTGIPVKSLYGRDLKSLRPGEDALSGLDAVIFDVQDAGSRYYTFVNSFTFMFEPCRKNNVEIFVLDRPNPAGCLKIEGNLVREGFTSFVGQYPLPNRHSLTAGELLNFIARKFFKDIEVVVVGCEGYERGLSFEDTGLNWVAPSPNMPSPETAVLYTGMCLLEGTNLSEGRGTARPFKVFGASYIKDPFALADRLNGEGIQGAGFLPMFFYPSCDKHAGELCGGVEIFITDRERFNSLLAGIAVLKNTLAMHRDHFRWRTEPYEFVNDRLAIDLLLGDDNIRYAIEAGASLTDIEGYFYAKAQAEFREEIRDFLIYD
ncbi:MAG: DUF1343 domain-containing protein [Deltaproteobacteria bacterium]|nr:DUF1343 domain-containing protein [Deltaproteobacteria bacterium]